MVSPRPAPTARGGGAALGRPALMLTMATVGFGLTFWAWVLLGPLSPALSGGHGLSLAAHGLTIAGPVLVASLSRLPVGVLTDRYGARVMFPIVALLTAIPVLGLAFSRSLPLIVALGCAAGIGGAAFSVGVPLVSNWYPQGRRGLAVGVFGLGNAGAIPAHLIGQRSATFGDLRTPMLLLGGLLIAYAAVAAAVIRDPITGRSNGSVLGECVAVLRTAAGTSLSVLYAITIGGIVALTLYLPTYLHTAYGQNARSAVAWTALLVGFAAVGRAVGGWLADRGMAVRLLTACYLTAAACFAVMAFLPRGALVGFLAFGCVAVCDGLACGALLALVCKAAPVGRVGAFAGVVGAAGAFGGLVPPLLLAAVHRLEHSYILGLMTMAILMLGVALYVRAHACGVGLGMTHPVVAPARQGALSLVVVSGADTDRGAPAVVARIAELASQDELVVICGQAERSSRRISPHTLLAGLRIRLPRHQIVAVLVDTQVPAFVRDCALFRDLLDEGAIPVAVIAVTADPTWQAVELAQQLAVDRMLYVAYDRTRGVTLNQVWNREPVTATVS